MFSLPKLALIDAAMFQAYKLIAANPSCARLRYVASGKAVFSQQERSDAATVNGKILHADGVQGEIPKIPERNSVNRLSNPWEKDKAENVTRPHIPVMRDEVIKMLEPISGKVFIDMTFGAGGHTEAILNAAEGTKVYTLDRDPLAFEYAKKMAHKYSGRVFPMLGKFSDLEQMLDKFGISKDSIDGVLFDVGASSMQMDDPGRGFALSKNGPLDMRMDGNSASNLPTARDVVNTLAEHELAKIFKVYGEEKAAWRVARAIIETKYMLKNINTTTELAALVEAVVGDDGNRVDKLKRPSHAATKIFQSIRIFVNNELNELNRGMELAHDYLKPGGSVVALTFHSLEDRIVKRHILGVDMDEAICATVSQKFKNAGKTLNKEEVLAIYTNHWIPKNKKVMTPSSEEVAMNPRSRSAKLRAAIKCVQNESN